jgi:hypothetical protein
MAVLAMTERQRLPNRRPCSSLVFRHNGSPYNLTVGFYTDGQVGETFIDGPRIGSEMANLVHDVAVLVSIAIQYKVPVEVMRGAVGRPEVTGTAHSIAGAVLDLIVREGGQ